MKRYGKTTRHHFYLIEKFPEFVPRVWDTQYLERLCALAGKDPRWQHIVPGVRELLVRRDD